ncbi:MAG: peptidoglycan DD-metalloendopeptidase family protein [Candidatus Bruticola sp.]
MQHNPILSELILALSLWGTSALLLSSTVQANTPPSSTAVPEVIKAAQEKYGLPSSKRPSVISHQVMSLTDLVNLQRQSCSWACVTSTFYDYRSVSIYRRRAGLHLGYDIAMQAGSAARAGWPGTVISIAPWSDSEWGVTVASSNGVEVTYGHIVPSVRLGQIVNTGDPVGTIAINHVDIKMRGADGAYIPFGEKDKQSVMASALQVQPVTSREQLMVAWLSAYNNEETVKEEAEARSREDKLNKIERQKLEERYTEKRVALRNMEDYFQQGLVSRREVEQTRKNLETTRQELLKVKTSQKEHPEKIKKLRQQLDMCHQRTLKAQKEAEERGLTWQDVQAFVNNLVAQDQTLNKTVKNYKKDKQEAYIQELLQVKSELSQCQRTLASQEELYQAGGLPQKEIEATRQKCAALQQRLKELQSR